MRVSTQPEKRKDRHNNDNQPDQINNIVHISLLAALRGRIWQQTKDTRDCSIIVIEPRNGSATSCGLWWLDEWTDSSVDRTQAR